MIQIVRPGRFIALIIGLIACIALGALWFAWGGAKVQKDGDITINSGENASTVWNKLEQNEFTDRTLPWKWYGWRQNAGANLQAGTYYLEKGEHVKDVIRRFISGDVSPNERTITYPEGFTLQQIAARTAAKGIGTEEQFKNAARPENFAEEFPFLASLSPERTLEGYLFPDTYRVFSDDMPHEVIERMLGTFDTKFTTTLRQEAKSAGRTVDEIVIMASIIEREVIHDEDMAKVADVLWKRYDDEAGLYADATIRYALDKWEGPLTVQDLDIDSPYNTRKYKGLPPGPISNPGLRAITAAVRPAETDYYYYLSAPDGTTVFSKTNDEHNRNKQQHLQ